MSSVVTPTTPQTPKQGHNDVQWEKSKDTSGKPSWMTTHSMELCFAFTFVCGIIFEYYLAYGTSAFIVCLVLSLIYQLSAHKHDNIPLFSLYWPIVGHYPWLIKYYKSFYKQECLEFINYSKQSNNNKPVPLMSLCLPHKTIILLTDPLLIDIIFRKQFGDAIKGPKQYESLIPLLGHGIFMSNGKVWKKHRAVASRMFTTRSLRDYMFQNFMETTDKMLLKCDELMVDTGINMYDMFLRLTFEAFTNTAFGVNVDAVNSAPNVVPFAKAFDESLEIVSIRFFALQWIWKTMRFLDIGMENTLRKHSTLMEAFVKDVICKRREYFQNLKNDANSSNSNKARNELRQKYDLLSLFIKDNPNISDTELRDITMNFIIAGRDTTAQTLGWFMYEMTKTNEKGEKINGDIEEKIRREIETVLAKNGETGVGNSLSYESMREMKYLEASFLETLRIHPSVPHLVRRALVDYNLGEITGDYETYNYTIRKGDEVMVGAFTMGRLPWNWNDPLVFKPERFYNAEKNEIIEHNASKYPAFNVVPRMCLGKNVALLEAKIAIVKLFTKYKNITVVPNQNICQIVAPTNHMKNGIKLCLK